MYGNVLGHRNTLAKLGFISQILANLPILLVSFIINIVKTMKYKKNLSVTISQISKFD